MLLAGAMPTARLVRAVVVLGLVARTADATTLADRLGSGFSSLSDAFGSTVARSLPLVAASAGVRFYLDLESGGYVRERAPAGQLFIERADVLGYGRWNVSLSWERIVFDRFDGQPLDDLSDPHPTLAPDGTPLYSLSHTDFHVEAQQVTASVTYGVTDALDVNLAVPIIYTALGRSDEVRILAPGNEGTIEAGSAASKTGVGDIFLRGKLRLLARDRFSLASGLMLRLPSGDPDEFQGTGDVGVVPMLYASTARWTRGAVSLQGHVNTGFDVDANDLNRSEARWALGLDAGLGSQATAALGFVGRDGIGRIAPPGTFDELHCLDPVGVCRADPAGSRKALLPVFGFTGGRPDYVDLSVGGRIVLWRDTLIVLANVLIPLTDQGLHHQPIPIVGLEAAF